MSVKKKCESCIVETAVLNDDAVEKDLVSQVINEVLATDSIKIDINKVLNLNMKNLRNTT
jgi:hypothetical protein